MKAISSPSLGFLDSRFVNVTGDTMTGDLQTVDLKLSGGDIYPTADSTTAIQINKADGTTNVLTVDTTNGRVGIGTTGPDDLLHLRKDQNFDTTLRVENQTGGTSAQAGFYAITNSSSGGVYVYDDGYTAITEATDKVLLFSESGSTATAIAAIDAGGEIQMYTGGIAAGNRRVTIDNNGNVGIGVTDPDTKLEIFNAGNQLKLSFDATDNAIFAVDTAGVLTITPSGAAVDFAGKNLTSLGTVTYGDNAPNIAPKCRAYLSAAQLNLTDDAFNKINFNAESYDIGGDYDTGNYRFVAPVTGYYQVNLTLVVYNIPADKRFDLDIYVNGASYASSHGLHSSSTAQLGMSISDVCYVTSGQYIEAYIRPLAIGGNTADIAGNANISFMSIHLLSV